MESGLPENVDELCDYIEINAKKIYVREQVNGKFGSFALTELSPELAIKHALCFVKESRIPIIIK